MQNRTSNNRKAAMTRQSRASARHFPRGLRIRTKKVLTYQLVGSIVRSHAMSTLSRNPEATRSRILESAFQEFYRNGFQGGSLNRIADMAGATKGALFHHFDGKNALGYAVVDEVLRNGVEERWLKPMRGSTDPIGTLKTMLN